MYRMVFFFRKVLAAHMQHKQRYNAFFMQLVSQLCFKGNTPPDNDIIKHLLDLAIHTSKVNLFVLIDTVLKIWCVLRLVSWQEWQWYLTFLFDNFTAQNMWNFTPHSQKKTNIIRKSWLSMFISFFAGHCQKYLIFFFWANTHNITILVYVI